MIANHYPLMFATRFNWLIVAIVLVIGPVIRHFFNMRHEGKGSPWWTWGVAAAGMIAVAWLSGAGPARDVSAARADRSVDVAAAHEHRAVPLQHVPRAPSRSGPASSRRPRASCSTTPRASAATPA